MIRRCLMVALLLLAATDALAQTPDMSDAPVVRKRLTWREGRVELLPSVGLTVNDRYFQNFLMGIGVNYHATNWISFGLSAGYGIPFKTGLTENIEAEKSLPGASYSMPATHLGLLADLHVGVVPFYGKMLLPGDIALAYDFHILGGIGVMQVVWNDEAAGRIRAEDQWELAPHFGAGFRVFVNEAFAVSIDVVDRLAATYVSARGDNSIPPEEWTHSIAVMLGFGIFLPSKVLTEE